MRLYGACIGLINLSGLNGGNEQKTRYKAIFQTRFIVALEQFIWRSLTSDRQSRGIQQRNIFVLVGISSAVKRPAPTGIAIQAKQCLLFGLTLWILGIV